MDSVNPGMQIRVSQGAAVGRVYLLDAATVSVGRTTPGAAPSNGFIPIDDDTVSRLHAEFRWNEARRGYTLVNRSATNPTVVNEVLIDQVELHAGDQIRMGECVCTFEPVVAVDAGETRRIKSSVSLTQRPPLFLEIVSGSDQGRKIEISGIVAALGGPPDASQPPPTGTDRWFDQDIRLNDDNLPARLLSLTWKELLHGFELTAKAPIPVPVRVRRQQGGLDWVGQLSPDRSAMLRANDILEVGANQLQVVVR